MFLIDKWTFFCFSMYCMYIFLFQLPWFYKQRVFLWNHMHTNSLVKIMFKGKPKPDLELPCKFESVLRSQGPRCFFSWNFYPSHNVLGSQRSLQRTSWSLSPKSGLACNKCLSRILFQSIKKWSIIPKLNKIKKL